jgi:pyridoxamine 5'-phosphate oxidase
MSEIASQQGDDDFTAATDPFALFDTWFAEAERSEPSDANAMALATVDASGMPNVRVVLLKGVDRETSGARGFVFYTNFESAKGRELLAHRRAAAVFHWKSLERQVRLRGDVSLVTHDEANAYFASRPRLSQVGAWASQQSRPLPSRTVFEAKMQHFEAKFAGGDVSRPSHWSGFRIVPVEIEFWQARPFRLHDRLVFRRPDTGGEWNRHRLYP